MYYCCCWCTSVAAGDISVSDHDISAEGEVSGSASDTGTAAVLLLTSVPSLVTSVLLVLMCCVGAACVRAHGGGYTNRCHQRQAICAATCRPPGYGK